MSSQEKRDIYYRLAKDYGLRARSAFKLLEIQNQYDILSGVTRVVDLCAAPGSWSQVLSQRLSYEQNQPPTIIAVDVQKVAEIPNVIHIEGDITRTSTLNEIMLKLGGQKADLVICDGAPDVTGVHDLDIYLQSQLIFSSLMIVIKVLKKGGNFVTKIFRGRNINPVILQLKSIFKNVSICKPSSSRMTSFEAFAVCQDFLGFENDLDFHNNPYYKAESADEDDLVVMYAAIKQRFNSDTNYAMDVRIEGSSKQNESISAIDKCDRILKNDAGESDEQLLEVKNFDINEMEWNGLFDVETMFSDMDLNADEKHETVDTVHAKQSDNNFQVSVDAILSNYSLMSLSPSTSTEFFHDDMFYIN